MVLPYGDAIRRQHPSRRLTSGGEAASLMKGAPSAQVHVPPLSVVPLMMLAAASPSAAQEADELQFGGPWLLPHPSGMYYVRGYVRDALNRKSPKDRHPGGPTMLVSELGSVSRDVFEDMIQQQPWPHTWTWSPALYLLLPDGHSELSGLYVLDDLLVTGAVWTRTGGGPRVAIRHGRGEARALLLHEMDDGSFASYGIDLGATLGHESHEAPSASGRGVLTVVELSDEDARSEVSPTELTFIHTELGDVEAGVARMARGVTWTYDAGFDSGTVWLELQLSIGKACRCTLPARTNFGSSPTAGVGASPLRRRAPRSGHCATKASSAGARAVGS